MDSTDIAFAGAAEQARMLVNGTITAPALLELYLDRIARVDRELRSYRVVFTESARREAAAAQELLDAGERKPLLGVPIAIKDDVDVADEFTCYGSSAYGLAPTADAEVVRRLREAGAVILGKTAVPEMMLWPFTETVAFGATHNPWDLARTPAAAAAAVGRRWPPGLAPMALGSDGAGSIRIPSTWCGLSVSSRSVTGCRSLRMTMPGAGCRVNGPMARTVEDAALFLDATTTQPGPSGGFVAAANREPGRLRIALSTKLPPTWSRRAGRGPAEGDGRSRDVAARARPRGVLA